MRLDNKKAEKTFLAGLSADVGSDNQRRRGFDV